MFDFLKRKKENAVRLPEKIDSLFSTHIEIPEGDYRSEFNRMIAFPRTWEDLRAVNPDGSKLTGEVTYAMDSATAGNVGALKPALQPATSIPETQLLWYAAQTFCGYQIAAIVAQHWLVDKVCSIPGRDAMRHGYKLMISDGSKVEASTLNKIKKLDKKYEIKRHATEFARFNRIFGIRIAIFKIRSNDPKFYEKPFNPDGIAKGSYEGIVQVDPYWITPELDSVSAADPASMNFYEPTWWRVGSQRYHRSHLIIIRNGEVADILKPTYLYGGMSVPQQIAERVYASERTANEAPMLAMTKRTTVWYMNMAEAMAQQGAFERKLTWFARMRDNFGVKAMGQNDKAEQFDTTLADLDDLIMTQYQLCAAIGRVPSVKLLETQPKGFNSSGDYEEQSYSQTLESIQEHEIEPLLDRHYVVLMKSEGMDLDIEIAWNPVDTPGAKEQAEINQIKAQTGGVLVASGAIDGVDERARIIADDDSGYSGIPDQVPEMTDAENEDENDDDQDE